jgi:hypothetical protein
VAVGTEAGIPEEQADTVVAVAEQLAEVVVPLATVDRVAKPVVGEQVVGCTVKEEAARTIVGARATEVVQVRATNTAAEVDQVRAANTAAEVDQVRAADTAIRAPTTEVAVGIVVGAAEEVRTAIAQVDPGVDMPAIGERAVHSLVVATAVLDILSLGGMHLVAAEAARFHKAFELVDRKVVGAAHRTVTEVEHRRAVVKDNLEEAAIRITVVKVAAYRTLEEPEEAFRITMEVGLRTSAEGSRVVKVDIRIQRVVVASRSPSNNRP